MTTKDCKDLVELRDQQNENYARALVVAQSLVYPEKFKPLRYAGPTGYEPTAASVVSTTHSVQITDKIMYALTRDPLCNFAVVAGTETFYQGKPFFIGPGTYAGDGAHPITPVLMPQRFTGGLPNQAIKHARIGFPGYGGHMMFMHSQAKLTIDLVDGETLPAGARIELVSYAANAIGYEFHNPFDVRSFSVTISKNAYYAIRFHGALATTLRFNPVVVEEPDTHWAHYTIPGLTNFAPTIDNIRIVSSSITLTNTTTQLAKGGTAYSAIVRNNLPLGDITADQIKFMAARQHTGYTGQAYDGMHAFLKPDGSQECFDWNQMSFANDFAPIPAPMRFDCTYTVFLLEMPATFQLPTTMLMTLHSGIEFTSPFDWYDMEYSDVTHQQFMDGFAMVRDMYPLTENPTHFKEFANRLWRGIQHTFSWMWEHRKAVIAAAEIIAPLVAV